MRATALSGRIPVAAVSEALAVRGVVRSGRYLRAVLSGEKRSRPALREVSAAVRALRGEADAELPDWL